MQKGFIFMKGSNDFSFSEFEEGRMLQNLLKKMPNLLMDFQQMK